MLTYLQFWSFGQEYFPNKTQIPRNSTAQLFKNPGLEFYTNKAHKGAGCLVYM